MSKKRILAVTEASHTLSGYGTYYREVLKRLHKTGKYEIAELAGYGKQAAFIEGHREYQPYTKEITWKYYNNVPNDNDPRMKEYGERPINQFGAWRFERTLLDFKPDIVFDIRDPWMFSWQNESPFRRFFHWVIMPTVDSCPQQEPWLDTFSHADAVMTYSDWGRDVLRKEGAGLIPVYKTAPPGVTLEEYRPAFNKIEHRRNMGFPQDALILGTVMRNQRRKLFPDLLDMFNLYLEKCKAERRMDLHEKSFLYFHTSYPDVAGCWNLPKLIKEKGLGNKVLFTYICHNCKSVAISCLQDVKTLCHKCNTISSTLPSVAFGLSGGQMADIFNTFDMYAQYATCEGFGMPQVEAAACGVPVMSTDYSAMSDVVRKIKGYPIKVGRFYRAVEEDANKALPDNEDAANKLFKFFSLTPAERHHKGLEARKAVEEHYTWDKTARIWEEYFDSAVLTGDQGKWDAPLRTFPVERLENLRIPDNMTNEQFVDWAIVNVLKDTDYLNSFMAAEMVRALNYEVIVAVNQSPSPYRREDVLNKLQSMLINNNNCEAARCGLTPVTDEDFIRFANARGVK